MSTWQRGERGIEAELIFPSTGSNGDSRFAAAQLAVADLAGTSMCKPQAYPAGTLKTLDNKKIALLNSPFTVLCNFLKSI
jgi:hypothetical protein